MLDLRYEVRAASVGAPPHPTLILLHGRGANEWDLLPLAAYLDPRLLVVSVRAPWPLGPGAEWYRMPSLATPEPTSFAESIRRLESFFAALPDEVGADPARLFGLGFSQGAVMLATLRLRQPTLLGGAVLLSGYLPAGAAVPGGGSAVWVGHGSADDIVPVRLGREMAAQLSAASVPVTYQEYPMGHQIAPEELAAISAWLTAALDAPEK